MDSERQLIINTIGFFEEILERWVQFTGQEPFILVLCINDLYLDLRKHDISKEECSICLEEMGEEWIELLCSHIFHKKCLSEWRLKRDECPQCRRRIN